MVVGVGVGVGVCECVGVADGDGDADADRDEEADGEDLAVFDGDGLAGLVGVGDGGISYARSGARYILGRGAPSRWSSAPGIQAGQLYAAPGVCIRSESWAGG